MSDVGTDIARAVGWTSDVAVQFVCLQSRDTPLTPLETAVKDQMWNELRKSTSMDHLGKKARRRNQRHKAKAIVELGLQFDEAQLCRRFEQYRDDARAKNSHLTVRQLARYWAVATPVPTADTSLSRILTLDEPGVANANSDITTIAPLHNSLDHTQLPTNLSSVQRTATSYTTPDIDDPRFDRQAVPLCTVPDFEDESPLSSKPR